MKNNNKNYMLEKIKETIKELRAELLVFTVLICLIIYVIMK